MDEVGRMEVGQPACWLSGAALGVFLRLLWLVESEVVGGVGRAEKFR